LEANGRRGLTLAILAATLAACASCGGPPPLELRYLPGFVPGSMNVFLPVRVAVAPAGGTLARGTVEVGAIYGPTGSVERRLYVRDAGATVTRAVLRCLADAGAKPVALDRAPAGGGLPDGVDLLLLTELETLDVNKRLDERRTVHGRYFVMKSRVRLKFVLRDRAGATLADVHTSGAQDEPPPPVGDEVFLPLETEPAESLSVALSKAVGALILDESFRRALPLRDSANLAPPARVPIATLR
jgi:hypothetical protein